MKPVIEISGSLLQLVTAAAHPMMGFQGLLEEDPEQVVTASLILEIFQKTECPEAGLAGMGILVASRVVLGVACVQWQGCHLLVGHNVECGLLSSFDRRSISFSILSTACRIRFMSF